MRLYNKLINELKGLLISSKQLNNGNLLNTSDKNSVIFLSDTAFELGGSNKPCVSGLAVSSDVSFSNSVYLLGNDLNKIKADSPFCKFVFIQIEDFEDEQNTFNKIIELESLRYGVQEDTLQSNAESVFINGVEYIKK